MPAAILGADYERVRTRSNTLTASQSSKPSKVVTNSTSVASSSTDVPMQNANFDFKKFRSLFDRAYQSWFSTKYIPLELRQQVESQDISIDDFLRLTKNRQFQRYISLIDGKIRFDELPDAPHGEIIGCVTKMIDRQLDPNNNLEILEEVSDNDCKLTNRNYKRPDSSFKLHRDHIPQPPPTWLKFLPNGVPYPNVVLEVAVNHEGPNQLLDDLERYFSAMTSIRLWIGVMYWKQRKKFWVGWADRKPGGVGAQLHTQFQWPPNHHDITKPTNIVYAIPMLTVFGPGIAIPPNLPPTLDIDTDVIRQKILKSI